ncbi:MAG: hypothetical protein M3Z83_03145 [Actinomycetota bacterium]|nr:hypothetical protein [Actinomycetota bacterium]
MTLVTDLKKTVTDTTPMFVAVGVTDLAVEKVRDARTQALAARKTVIAVDPKGLSHELTVQAEKAAKQVQDLPAHLLNRSLEIAGKAQEQYGAFATRGEKLVNRIRTQKATKDLLGQVDQTVAVSKGAVTTVRKAVASTQSSARATFTTGRKEAAKTAGTVRAAIEKDVDTTAAQAKDSAKRTRTAAKRTTTTARKGAAASTSRAKASTTTARKTATRARKATAAGAQKVGS